MPRRTRLNLADVPQHIIQRGNNRQATFFAEEDYRFYLDCLLEAARKYDCQIYAYVLMTNHVHLLASAPQRYALSRMMQHLGRRFVRHINRVYQRSGTLWEGRFKASLVDTEIYFLRCLRYIECNPVRARMVADPADYRWSSYRAHALGLPDKLVVAHEQYERLGETDGERQSAYRALFRSELALTELNEIRDTVNCGWPLGGERFRDEIERALARTARPPKRGRPARSVMAQGEPFGS
ncbi:MAG: transposase [Betaproteobacteria bacterium]|nr:transposase [Betaproteobacteria bacterium]